MLKNLSESSPRNSLPTLKPMPDVCLLANHPLCLHSDFELERSCIAFDPKPFIRTFEAAVDRLIAVRKDVQAKTEQMEKSVRVAEREYSKKMADLNKQFDVRRGLHYDHRILSC